MSCMSVSLKITNAQKFIRYLIVSSVIKDLREDIFFLFCQSCFLFRSLSYPFVLKLNIMFGMVSKQLRIGFIFLVFAIKMAKGQTMHLLSILMFLHIH